MNITVIGPRVMIRPDKLPEMIGGLHVVRDRSQSTMRGTVVAVGDGPEFAKRAAFSAIDALCGACDDSGGSDPMPFNVWEVAETLKEQWSPEHVVSVGDKVLFSPDSGEELIFEKDVLVCMREDDILAVVGDDGEE